MELNRIQTELSRSGEHIKVYVWIAIVVASLGVALNAYLYFLRLSYLIQGAESARQGEEIMQELRAKRANTFDIYVNNLFGFVIGLPESWKGYAVNHIKEDIYDVTGLPADAGNGQGKTTINNGVVDSFQLVEIHHPLETAKNPREDMPVMVFTHEQWANIQKGEWSVGAAPIPPTILGQNSQWIMALPARYNYDFKPGWEEVDELVHTLKAFEPLVQ